MKKIVAIGGGKLKNLETLRIDKKVIRLSDKRRPKALFIPTASNDSENYWEIFQKVYGKKLGCKADVLYLFKSNLSKEQIKDKILSSDLIYVGGGNTLKMVKLWRKLGIDKLLRTAYNKGIVLSGLSAGSICWFKYGYSDSLKFYNPKKWRYIRMKGLGFINATHSPHYTGEKRKKGFQKIMKKYGGIGIALDDNCAIEFIENKYKVITSKKHAKAYKIYKRKGKIITEIIKQRKEFASITTLLIPKRH